MTIMMMMDGESLPLLLSSSCVSALLGVEQVSVAAAAGRRCWSNFVLAFNESFTERHFIDVSIKHLRTLLPDPARTVFVACIAEILWLLDVSLDSLRDGCSCQLPPLALFNRTYVHRLMLKWLCGLICSSAAEECAGWSLLASLAAQLEHVSLVGRTCEAIRGTVLCCIFDKVLSACSSHDCPPVETMDEQVLKGSVVEQVLNIALVKQLRCAFPHVESCANGGCSLREVLLGMLGPQPLLAPTIPLTVPSPDRDRSNPTATVSNHHARAFPVVAVEAHREPQSAPPPMGELVYLGPLQLPTLVQPAVLQAGSQYLHDKYDRAAHHLDRRRSKAAWQIQRMMRMAEAKKRLRELYVGGPVLHITSALALRSVATHHMPSHSSLIDRSLGEEEVVDIASTNGTVEESDVSSLSTDSVDVDPVIPCATAGVAEIIFAAEVTSNPMPKTATLENGHNGSGGTAAAEAAVVSAEVPVATVSPALFDCNEDVNCSSDVCARKVLRLHSTTAQDHLDRLDLMHRLVSSDLTTSILLLGINARVLRLDPVQSQQGGLVVGSKAISLLHSFSAVHSERLLLQHLSLRIPLDMEESELQSLQAACLRRAAANICATYGQTGHQSLNFLSESVLGALHALARHIAERLACDHVRFLQQKLLQSPSADFKHLLQVQTRSYFWEMEVVSAGLLEVGGGLLPLVISQPEGDTLTLSTTFSPRMSWWQSPFSVKGLRNILLKHDDTDDGTNTIFGGNWQKHLNSFVIRVLQVSQLQSLHSLLYSSLLRCRHNKQLNSIRIVMSKVKKVLNGLHAYVTNRFHSAHSDLRRKLSLCPSMCRAAFRSYGEFLCNASLILIADPQEMDCLMRSDLSAEQWNSVLMLQLRIDHLLEDCGEVLQVLYKFCILSEAAKGSVAGLLPDEQTTCVLNTRLVAASRSLIHACGQVHHGLYSRHAQVLLSYMESW